MLGSQSASDAPRRYAVALGVVAGAMALRFALNPVVGTRIPYLLQFVAVLVAARYFGFGPALAGLALATVAPVYRAVAAGTDSPRYWLAMVVAWGFCIGLIWLLDRHRRMSGVVADSTRLAEERLQEL